ncbi:orotidine 5'-phosphate decarboxylase / HUMPS family protein [Staphylococcus arlettae]|uniref:orotidine 5'-phosphate decarboxylase / HUMPS family protein n=1 Tax=Staphylococcus TaxID=1279 RepID=UPI000E6A8BBA|nr:orotidine 5'-phosphate decarboxylase / HUMPS family protein [Staphylococcus arlettae]RIM60492.1 3-hexulose-6-phosphate synthase [Staphylococcus arlettae]
MKLQVAIDRIPLEEAVELAKQLNGNVDIIEMGTSLVKDYGNLAIQKIKEVVNESQLLVDSKTIDEGKYEFDKAFKHGADIVTVMGAATEETLEICYSSAKENKGKMMIDLLNLKEDQIINIPEFPEAIWLLHHSVDANKKVSIAKDICNFRSKYSNIKNIGIAGGVNLQDVKLLKNQGLTDIVVVGSKIIKTDNPLAIAKEFMEAVK